MYAYYEVQALKTVLVLGFQWMILNFRLWSFGHLRSQELDQTFLI